MVLTEDEYREAKSNSRLSNLFKLRNVTKSYIIQCLADREIQRSINNLGQQSKAYGYNCKVIHSPEMYADVEAVLCEGWDSINNKPCCKPRILSHLSAGTQDGQQLNKIIELKSQITNLEKTIIDLKRENFRQCQKNQQVKAPASEKKNSFTVSKVQSARIQQLEALVASRERAILAFEASNKRLERALINTLNGSNAYKGVSNGSNEGNKTPSDASSLMNLQNLLISTGICLIVYKKPELVHWVSKKFVELSRIISVYFLYSFI
ncbi:uncharacterized protein LOC124327278 [Daphnia pulicaria]|uniref:uncharacterized protein LOC124327278 n=1 Tax=Daphnia pulicaria TaxID=35523 RepID=UPI001EEA1585|nr:uncharacterized protein LOC124327278 [Daphnia pulicaria]